MGKAHNEGLKSHKTEGTETKENILRKQHVWQSKKNYKIKKKLVQEIFTMCLYLRFQSGGMTLIQATEVLFWGPKSFSYCLFFSNCFSRNNNLLLSIFPNILKSKRLHIKLVSGRINNTESLFLHVATGWSWAAPAPLNEVCFAQVSFFHLSPGHLHLWN